MRRLGNVREYCGSVQANLASTMAKTLSIAEVELEALMQCERSAKEDVMLELDALEEMMEEERSKVRRRAGGNGRDVRNGSHT